MQGDDLEVLLRDVVAQPVAPAIAAIVAAARQRHGAAVSAVLFYGSCLRQNSDEGKIVDLYLLVDTYKSSHRSRLSALLNWALPPNVYYIEAPFEGRQVRAKYAVVSLADFAAGAGGKWFHPYLWARFAQPCRLAFCRDDATRAAVIASLGQAIRKTAEEGLALMERCFDCRDLWVAVFGETYRTELRAEPPERAVELYEANRQHFDRAGAAVLEALRVQSAEPEPSEVTAAVRSWIAPAGSGRGFRSKWLLRRVQGKILSVLRLIKAAFTFQGGAQYLLWKIERHSGVSVSLTPWQCRHPVLASTVLFWRLYRKGAFR